LKSLRIGTLKISIPKDQRPKSSGTGLIIKRSGCQNLRLGRPTSPVQSSKDELRKIPKKTKYPNLIHRSMSQESPRQQINFSKIKISRDQCRIIPISKILVTPKLKFFGEEFSTIWSPQTNCLESLTSKIPFLRSWNTQRPNFKKFNPRRPTYQTFNLSKVQIPRDQTFNSSIPEDQRIKRWISQKSKHKRSTSQDSTHQTINFSKTNLKTTNYQNFKHQQAPVYQVQFVRDSISQDSSPQKVTVPKILIVRNHVSRVRSTSQKFHFSKEPRS